MVILLSPFYFMGDAEPPLAAPVSVQWGCVKGLSGSFASFRFPVEGLFIARGAVLKAGRETV